MATILVVDDDALLVNMLVETLLLEGHEVTSASDGEEAINVFAKSPADLVITDILMPNKDGFETIQAFRNTYQDVRILAVSGGGLSGEGSFLKEARLFGADLVLMKPF